MFNKKHPIYYVPRVGVDANLFGCDDEYIHLYLALGNVYNHIPTSRQYKLIEMLNRNTLIMQDIKTTQLKIIATKTISDVIGFSGFKSAVPNECIGDDKWHDMHNKHFAIVPLLTDYSHGHKRPDEQSADVGIPVEKLISWLDDFNNGSDITSLLDRKRAWNTPKTNIGITSRQYIQDSIQNFYLSTERPTVGATIRRIQSLCDAKNIARPDSAMARNIVCRVSDTAMLRQRRLMGVKAPKISPFVGVVPKSHTEVDDNLYYFEEIE